jgi:aspartate racemase
MDTMPKTIGVLGGMGPEATGWFFQRLVELTPAQSDQQHIPIIIYNQPQIPDRTRAILAQGESPVTALKKGIAVLQNAGVEFICIPCNTAHHYFPELLKVANVPIINLIDCVVEYGMKTMPRLQKVGLLATIGTIKASLYQNAFARHNVDVILPEDWELNDLQSILNRLKSKNRESFAVQKMAEGLVDRGAEAVILGCTELSLIAAELNLPVAIFDSTEILAQKAVRCAHNLEPLPSL